jgi:FMN phosphatase YigB (HAD superfamily)
MSTPRLILFDYGGVIADHYAQPYLNALALLLGVSSEQVLEEVSESTEHGKQYRLNRLSQNEFWSAIVRRVGCLSLDSDLAQKLWAQTYIPNRAMLSSVSFLKERCHVFTGLALNEDAPRLSWVLEELGDARNSFDCIFASCEIGCLKPSPEFYRHILDHNPWHLTAGEILVIDDRSSHIETPHAMGFQVYRHENPGACIRHLSKIYDL